MAIGDVDLKIPLKAAGAAAVSSATDGGLPTKETGTFVLKPFRSPKSKKLKATVVFVPRLSHFDIDNERSNNNEFRVRLPSPVTPPKHTAHLRNDQIRGSSHSFGSQSSYGQSARTFEA